MKNRNMIVEREMEFKERIIREVEAHRGKLDTVIEKAIRKVNESNVELGTLTERAIVLSQDHPERVKEEDGETEEEMDVDDDRRRKRRNDTKDERMEPKR